MGSIPRWCFFAGFATTAAIGLWVWRRGESRIPSASAPKAIELSHYVGPWFVNFGNPKTNVVHHTFSFRNTTNDLFLLRPRYVSCGCVETGIDPPRVAPGEKGTVSLAFDTLYRLGRRTEFIEIATGSDAVPIVRCRLTVSVFPSIIVLPHGRKLETTVDAGESVARDFTVVTYSPPNHQRSTLTYEAPESLSVSVDEPVVSRREDVVERKYPCRLRVAASELPTYGVYKGRIVWRSGNNEFFTAVNIRVAPVITVEPAQMFASGGGSSPQELRIRLSAKQPFLIASIENDGNGLRVDRPDSSLSKKNTHELIVTFTPSAVREPRQGMSATKRTILFHTDLEDSPVVPFVVWVLQD